MRQRQIDGMQGDIKRLQQGQENFSTALYNGRNERLGDTQRLSDRIADLNTQIAVLRSRQEGARQGKDPFDPNRAEGHSIPQRVSFASEIV